MLRTMYLTAKRRLNQSLTNGLLKLRDLHDYGTHQDSQVLATGLRKASQKAASLLKLGVQFPRLSALLAKNECGSLVFVGDVDESKYYRSLLLGSEHAIASLGRVAHWEMADATSQWLKRYDLVLCHVSDAFSWKIPAEYAVDMPVSVRQELHLDCTFDETVNRIPQKGMRKTVRRTLNKRYGFRASHCQNDLRRFYETMYLPTMNARHAGSPGIISFQTMQWALNRGYLFFLQEDGCDVAGGIGFLSGDVYHALSIGVLNGDPSLYERNLGIALYAYEIRFLSEMGIKRYDFGYSLANNIDSLYAFKRRWGAKAVDHTICIDKIMLRARELNPEWKRTLNQIGFITKLQDGHALVHFDNGSKQLNQLFHDAHHAGTAGVKIVQNGFNTVHWA